jgi:hypothetical protein
MTDTPAALSVDPWAMTPEQATAALAQMQTATNPPPPVVPVDAQDARARLDALSRNPSWAQRLFSGNVEARREFNELVAKAAGGDDVGDAIAGIVEPAAPLFETTANGELPPLRRRFPVCATAA